MRRRVAGAKTAAKKGKLREETRALGIRPRDIGADVDPIETGEWLDSFNAVLHTTGRERARFLLTKLIDRARAASAIPDGRLVSDFVNTIAHDEEPTYPGDLEMERRIRRIIRWNALAMVHRANARFPGLGGHLSTYASAASLYEVGFNHFFRGRDAESAGDHIFYQGHAAPGIYARSFLEGTINAEQLDHFRRETERGAGLPSYPHPRLLPEYWEFPTVSMGLGPITAIYQARFNRYLHARGLTDTSNSRVWAFLGDGETDEPESLGSLSIAARERLDNLTFVVNCNLQRLDGPVRGNSKIVQELEAVFRGAGWNVVKVIWGSEWDDIFERDREGRLRNAVNALVDGYWQKLVTMTGSEVRKEFFERFKILDLVDHLSDRQLRKLRRGGHDMVKLHAAYKRATEDGNGRPTCILAHTVKGWTLGEGFEAKNVTHQMKKMELDELRTFRDRLQLPISDRDLPDAPYYHPGPDSDEVSYLRERRRALGGALPSRSPKTVIDIKLPESELYEEFQKGTKEGKDGVSTTIAFVRLLSKLIKHDQLGKHIVPIIPDEARTFGMDPFFRMVGIYASKEQIYEPVDAGLLLYYREATDGQVLEEGITEAGSMASFTAAGTSYATHGVPMVPFYVFYSMFGFQRTGDQMWQFADARGRGFLLGATAGRTTLNGEGLQHADGHSQVLASCVPNVQAYDPAFAYEIAIIVREGLRRMVDKKEDVFYYITLQNENYPMPKMPHNVEDDVLRGMYRLRLADKRRKHKVQLFGSGSILNEVLRAQSMLAARFDISADVWSVTSYQQMRTDALACERWNMLHPGEDARVPFVTQQLGSIDGPFVAASDWLRTLPELITRWIPGRYMPLGTDGFGMSDTRRELRRWFEVDAESIVIAAVSTLVQEGKLPPETVTRAMKELDFDPDKMDPLAL